MAVSPGEIYYLDDKEHRLRASGAGRFVLVLRVEQGFADIVFFSTRFDLFRDHADLAIYEEWKEFPATGLKATCYLIGDYTDTVEMGKLTDRRGKIEGDFKKSVEEWWGQAL